MLMRRRGAAQILVRQVEELLIVRVGMDGGQSCPLWIPNVSWRTLATGRDSLCAGCVRNDMVLRRIVGFVVHA